MRTDWWATHTLVEYLSALVHSPDEASAVRNGLERAAETVEAEIAVMVKDGQAVIAVGLPGEVPVELTGVVGKSRSRSLTLPGLGRCTAVSVPLHPRTGGYLVLARVGDQRFLPEEINLVRGMAGALWLSQETMRLLEAERRARETSDRHAAANAALAASLQERRLLLERLTRIQRSISHRAPLPEVLHAITAGAAELLGDRIAVLRLLDPTDPRYTVEVSSVGLQSAAGRLAITDGISGRAIREDRVAVLDSQTGSPEEQAAQRARGLASAMAAPVHEHGRPVGALFVGSESPDRRFRPVEHEILEAFAQHASLALTDARTVQAMELAYQDGLTGLASRDLFVRRLESASTRNRRSSRFALLYLDVDSFKVINDSLGHAAGDELLVQIGDRIRSCLRRGDFAGRLGGDEFAILMENVHRPADAVGLARRLLDALGQPFSLEGKRMAASASVGVALSLGHGETGTELLRNADVAMYRAKAAGKNRFVVFEPRMYAAALARMELQSDLLHAIEGGELRVQFQPIVDMGTRWTHGFEALVRWQHPSRGLISPLDFIPVAEETGIIHEVERWVLHEALDGLRRVRAEAPGWSGLGVSVNLSPHSIRGRDLADEVRAALGAAGIPPHLLTMEVTESALLHDNEATVRTLQRLKDMGVRLAIDDFGAGYSSLTYLTMCDFDTLKVDRAFIRNMVGAGEAAPIARAILAMAKILDLEVIAEGVETVHQVSELREMGCPLGQGDYFSRPLDLEDLAGFIERDQLEPERGVIVDLPLLGTLLSPDSASVS
ncbi:MAG TPA: EAL domain-containing protein [Candidatus Binatia bacterium]|nr:EAL domain-containing protein [Candidatus Binatia bacterium]